MTDVPLTRWELGGASTTGFADRFAALIEQGQDIDGEARLADALVERGARILDAGAGFGRVGAALQARGHRVIAAEKDPSLVGESRRRYPDLTMVQADILELTADRLDGGGFDLIMVVGNVLVLLAPDTERRVLSTLSGLLAVNGRILAGFQLKGGHGNSRPYPFEEFEADAASAGLRVQHRFGTYQLGAPVDDYAVVVLTPSHR
jgi:SAM-dependent methyltransferase